MELGAGSVEGRDVEEDVSDGGREGEGREGGRREGRIEREGSVRFSGFGDESGEGRIWGGVEDEEGIGSVSD